MIGPSSALPSSEVYLNRRAQMFPKLSDAEIARIARVAAVVEVAEGSILYDEGDYDSSFFVVLEGAIAVVHPNGSQEESVALHGPRDFTGEIRAAGRPASAPQGTCDDAVAFASPHTAATPKPAADRRRFE